MTKKQTGVITFLSLLVIVLGILLSGRVWFRLDLSKNRTYTISKVSRNLYKEIPDRVLITYYLSEKLSARHPIPSEIAGLLREYADYSHGKIRVAVKDPVKANLSDIAEQLGVQPRQMPIIEQDQSSVTTVYSGITIEYLDKTAVLPFILSLDTLEYDLTSRIRALIRGTEREIGVIVGDAGKQWEQNFQYLDLFLKQADFRIRQIRAGEEIPAGLSAVFVFGGVEDFDEWALYRIDNFIQNGGNALFALGSVSINMEGDLSVRALTDNGLLSLLSSYGVTVKTALALDRSQLFIEYQTASNRSGIPMIKRVGYPLWINILGKSGNADHPLTSRFTGIDLFWASPLELSPSSDALKIAPLFATTEEAWLETKDFSANPEISYLLEAEKQDTKGVKVMSAALNGVFPSYFAGKPKPVREGSEESLPDAPEKPKESRVIVIGNGDVASSFAQRRNFDFMVQAALYLNGGDDDVIAIRNRPAGEGRLDKISDPIQKASLMKGARVVNLFFVPVLIIAFGLFFSWKRSKKIK